MQGVLLMPEDQSASLEVCWFMELVNQSVGRSAIYFLSLSLPGLDSRSGPGTPHC
jgi:hypothetical protein